MSILSFLGSAIAPIFQGIDSLTTSDEEKGQIRIELTKLENVVKEKMLDLEGQRMELEGKLIQAQSAVIIAETQSQSWLTRSWRPLIMVEFGLLIFLIATGVMDTEALAAVPPELWKLLTLGIGGYLGLRTADKAIEKAVPGFGIFGKKKADA